MKVCNLVVTYLVLWGIGMKIEIASRKERSMSGSKRSGFASGRNSQDGDDCDGDNDCRIHLSSQLFMA